MTVPDRQTTPALLQIDAIFGRLTGRSALSELCRFLHEEFSHYGWVGVYRKDGAELVLESYAGPEATEHVRIPIDQGICGRAARENRSVVVEDVREAPEYLACFLSTRAEVVVPVRGDEGVLGEIDIDGQAVKAFDASDVRFLERIAAKIAPALRLAADEPRPPA